jgi:ABC-type branched-subunit amino acid transport system ATPase component/predicted MFS family arabinose efflux permease
VPERPLVPTAREQEFGRAAEAITLTSPRAIAVDDDEVFYDNSSLLRRIATFTRSLDPRSFGVPLLPMFAVGFVTTAQNWDSNLFGLLAPDIQSSLGVDLSVLVSISAIVAIAGQGAAPWLGYLADRLDRVRMLRIGALIANAAYVATGFVGALPALVAARVTQGVGAQVVRPPGLTLLPDYYPVAARIQIVSFLFAVGGAVTVVTPIVGGFSAAAFGWRATIVAFGVIALALSLLLFFVRETPRGFWERKALGASDEVARHEQQPASWAECWRALSRVGTVRWQWFSTPPLALASTFSVLFSSLYFSQHYGLDVRSRGIITTIAAAFGLFCLLFLAPYAGRIADERPRFLVGFVAANGLWSAMCYLVVYLTGNLTVAVIAIVAQAGAANLIFPLQFGLISLVSPPRMRGFGIQTVTFFALPGSLVFYLYFYNTNSLHTAIVLLIATSIAGSVLLLPALGHVERDVRNGIVSAMADEEAVRLRESGDTPLLMCRGVEVAYGGVQVLFGVDLTVRSGEIVALLGTNGAGKSTLLRAIAGLQPASAGAVFIDGEDVTHRPAHDNAADGIVMVPGGLPGAPSLTVDENLRAAGWLHRHDAKLVAAGLHDAYELFPALRQRRNAQLGSLSGGEQQMVALAQALLLRPRLLMIDELSLGLAPAVVQDLLDRLRALNADGTTILLVEQSINVALTIAERAVFLDRGDVRFDGPATELLARPELVRAVFMGRATTGGSSRRRARSAEPAEPVLSVQDVSVSFGGVRALTDVSLSVAPREIVGLIGPNGAGKTTLFDVVSGLLAPDAGAVALKGLDVSSWPMERRAARGLGRSFQSAQLFSSLTVRETVTVALQRRLEQGNPLLAAIWAPSARASEARAAHRVDDALELLGLQHYADVFVGELSTGARRAVDMACVMMSAPDVLLLDEPSSGLAQAETEALGPVILRLVRETGCAVVLIEHDFPLVTSVADRLVAMELGQVIASGSPDEVINDAGVRAAYLSASTDVLHRSGSRLSEALAAAGFATAGEGS